MEIVTHRFKCGRGGPETLIMPIGDIQWAGCDKEVALDKLRRHIEWGVEQDAYFLGMGDYIDFLSPSNRARLQNAGLYDTATAVIEDKARDLVTELYERALKPSVGRWLGLLEGHHFSQYADGSTSDMQLCQLLKTKHLGTSAYVRLVFHRGTGKKTPFKTSPSGSVLIWCHHGTGGGQTTGASLNRIEKMIKGFEADIYLVGHDTKIVSAPLDRLEPRFPAGKPPKLVHKTRLMASTGGFMLGYLAGSRRGSVPRGGYVEQKMMTPTALGGVAIRVTPRWVDDYFIPDLRVSA